jgi:hypothetical protein
MPMPTQNLAGGDPEAMLGDLYHRYGWAAPLRSQRERPQVGALTHALLCYVYMSSVYECVLLCASVC